MKPKCIRCKKKPGKLPKEMPMYCSLACIYSHVIENHMDWEQCEHCLEWMDRRYGCYNDNCPSLDDSLTTETADELTKE